MRAIVFQVGSSPPFVAYLTRLNEDGRRRMEELRALPASQSNGAAIDGGITESGPELTLTVGETIWLAARRSAL